MPMNRQIRGPEGGAIINSGNREKNVVSSTFRNFALVTFVVVVFVDVVVVVVFIIVVIVVVVVVVVVVVGPQVGLDRPLGCLTYARNAKKKR